MIKGNVNPFMQSNPADIIWLTMLFNEELGQLSMEVVF